MSFWTSAILRLLTFPKSHIHSSVWCAIWDKHISSCQNHSLILYVLWDISLGCTYLSCKYIFQSIWDREKLHKLHDQSWTVLSKQRFLKMWSEGSWDCLGLSPKHSPLAIEVLDLMRLSWAVMSQHVIFNLRLHLNLRSSDKQHPRCWSLALLSSLFAVLGGSSAALSWKCQYSFTEINKCFGCLILGGTKARLETPAKCNAPFLRASVSVARGYWSLKFYS